MGAPCAGCRVNTALEQLRAAVAVCAAALAPGECALDLAPFGCDGFVATLQAPGLRVRRLGDTDVEALRAVLVELARRTALALGALQSARAGALAALAATRSEGA